MIQIVDIGWPSVTSIHNYPKRLFPEYILNTTDYLLPFSEMIYNIPYLYFFGEIVGLWNYNVRELFLFVVPGNCVLRNCRDGTDESDVAYDKIFFH